ncbi:MAG: O-antigen ligase family protein [Myxococcota bacterium]|nr:O-antigen ligase family protein [Myxococcota bacterium]
MLSSLTDSRKVIGLISVVSLCLAPALGYAIATAPKVVLGGLGLGVSAILLFIKPVWGVYLLVVGTSFDSISIRTPFATLGAADLSSLALVPVWIMSRLVATHTYRLPFGFPVLIAFFFLAFVSLMVGVAPSMAYGNYARLVIYGLTLLAVVDLVRTIESLERILILMAVCGLLQALIGLALGAGGGHRFSGLVDQPNLLGAKIAFGLFPMVAWFMRARKQLHRALLFGAISLMVLCIILTISRGTYVAVLLGALWWFRKARRTAVVLTAVFALAFASVGYFGSAQYERIERRLEFTDSSAVNRAIVAQNALVAIKAKPFLGVGYGQFKGLDQVVDINAEKKRGGHSFYLSLAASSGMPVVFLFLLFASIQWRRMRLTNVGWQPNLRGRDVWSEQFKLAWMTSLFQALMVYHAFSLTIRGSQRLTEWTMLALYCAVASVVQLQRDRQTQMKKLEKADKILTAPTRSPSK